MSNIEDWVTIYSHKLCPYLTEKVNESFRKKKGFPSFLHGAVVAARHYLVRHKVIVTLEGGLQAFAENSKPPKKLLNCKVTEPLDLINGFSTKVNLKTLNRLLAHEAVQGVWYDREVRALLDVAAPTLKAPLLWQQGNQGKGVGIAIIDTGIYPHPDLLTPGKRIMAFKDFVRKRGKPYDDNGHGTHCAGDAAGNGYKSGGKYRGAAPKANLIGVKVLDKSGSGSTSQVIAGVQWCINNRRKYNIRVLSLSLGVEAELRAADDPLCQVVRKAWEAGIVVCAAAGNEGPAARSISSPGIEPVIITVGAIDDRNSNNTGDDRIADFSSRGPTPEGAKKPDLVAPGVNIVSLRAPGSQYDREMPKARVGRYYTTMSGTSMATPLCAGVVALLLSEHPDYTPNQVKKTLVGSCQNINGRSMEQGSGLINCQAAAKYKL